MAIYNQNNLPWELMNLSQCEAFKLWLYVFLRDVLQPSQKLWVKIYQVKYCDLYYVKAQSKWFA